MFETTSLLSEVYREPNKTIFEKHYCQPDTVIFKVYCQPYRIASRSVLPTCLRRLFKCIANLPTNNNHEATGYSVVLTISRESGTRN